MLIRKEKTSEGGLIGIWRMNESKDELLSLFSEPLRSEVEEYIKEIGSHRRTIELLSTRIMLLEILGEEKNIYYREDGKPYLDDKSYHISISHTKDYAAIFLHNTLSVGIDIETRSERVRKIANRFISEKEYIDPTQKSVHQLLHWSTKESLFKLMNEQGVDFKKHLHLAPFTPVEKGILKAWETKTKKSHTFNVNYEVHPEYVLTWVVG